ncbi:MAG: hypothetical protein ISS15_21150 [Alphaproteobacteria bacterium]|nr:hypothetical protein [Reyranella sp.]MBL6940087.1 hypothetical protein [Alphaproteobacteria bacterium]MBL7100174.1 hypothetical protein [Alphaproteobacteria bacterium]
MYTPLHHLKTSKSEDRMVAPTGAALRGRESRETGYNTILAAKPREWSIDAVAVSLQCDKHFIPAQNNVAGEAALTAKQFRLIKIKVLVRLWTTVIAPARHTHDLALHERLMGEVFVAQHKAPEMQEP